MAGEEEAGGVRMVCGTRLEPQAVLLPLALPMASTLGLTLGPTLGQATAHARLTSTLRKRGEPPRVLGSAADAKAKGPIERKYAPEEVCHRLLTLTLTLTLPLPLPLPLTLTLTLTLTRSATACWPRSRRVPRRLSGAK